MTEHTTASQASASPRKPFLKSALGRSVIVVGALAALGAGAAAAQGWSHGPRGMGGHGGMMGGRGFERLCAVDVNYVTQRMADGMAKRLNLTDAQKPALNDLRAAAVAAAAEAKKACGEKPDMATAVGRMAAAQQRLTMAGTALGTIKPKFDAFYASLNDEQKKMLDQMGPRGRGGRGQMRGQGMMDQGMMDQGMMGQMGGPMGGPGHMRGMGGMSGMGGMGGMGGMPGRPPVQP